MQIVSNKWMTNYHEIVDIKNSTIEQLQKENADLNKKIEELRNKLDASYKTINTIRRWLPNIEQVALSFNDLEHTGSAVIQLTRVDPDKVFTWSDSRR